MEKNNKIQVLRGIAIVAVVLIHTVMSGYPEGIVIRSFINFAVAMFIFISGYLTKMEIKDVKKFYTKRIVKVIIPYLMWTVIYTVMLGRIDSFVWNLLTAGACVTFYYIYVYIQLVLLTPLVIKMIKSKYRVLGWLISPISIILTRYIAGFVGIPEKLNDVILLLCFNWFGFYYAGMILGNKVKEIKVGNIKIFLLYIITTGISIAEGVAWHMYGNEDLATTQLRLSSLLASGVVLVIAYLYLNDKLDIKNKVVNKVLTILGDNSFGIFLSHILIMRILSKIPYYDKVIFPLNTIIILFITVLCVEIGNKILRSKSFILGLQRN